MRRLVLHLLVAVLAFFVGVTAAMLLGRSGDSRRVERCPKANAVFYTTAEERPPLPFHHSCPNARAFTVAPLADEPLPPKPPLPPDGEEGEVRIRIRRENGKVRIIKTFPAESR